jgi:hypothetical protein
MNYNPKTEHLKPWRKGDKSPNPNGRPFGIVTLLKNEGYSPAQVNKTILQLLTLTEFEISELQNNLNATILERTIAKALIRGLNSGSLYALESLLNRSVGMPSNKQNLQIESKSINVTLSL